MLLISASFITGAMRERKRHEQAGRTQRIIPFTQFHRQPSQFLNPQLGMVIPVEKPVHQTSFSLPRSWYTRRRMLVSLGLLLMTMLTLFVQSGLADGALQNLGKSLNLLNNSFNASDLSTAAHL